MILGAHVSTAGGVSNAPLNAEKLGITTCQIFTKNQNRWKSKPLEPDEIEKFQSLVIEMNISPIIAHDAYLINLCAIENYKLDMSKAAFLDEMIRADQLRIDFLVTHPGSHLGAGAGAGIKKIAKSLKELFDRQSGGQCQVLLETTAGQGTNLGYTFDQIAEMLELTDYPERMGVCLDTCHIFAAGYDIRTQDEYAKVMLDFDRIVGLGNLKAVHFNDSKKELGTRVDRHENIGDGFIGKDAFGFLLNDERLKDVPAILETPGGVEAYQKDLDLLRSLISTN